MVVLMPSALGDLGLDFLNVAAEKVGHFGDRHDAWSWSHAATTAATIKLRHDQIVRSGAPRVFANSP
jgi:hypothetical protein